MVAPFVTLEEAEKFKAFLKNFNLDLYTTIMDGKIIMVSIKDLETGFFLKEHNL